MTLQVIESLGFSVAPVRNRFASNMVCQLAGELPAKGTFIVRVAHHVLCAKDGVVHDWTQDRQHRIKEIYEVTVAA